MKNSDTDIDPEDDLRQEYDLKTLRVRKVGPERSKSAQHVVLLDPDVAVVFPDSSSVNEALRFLIRITKKEGPASPIRGAGE